MSLLHSSLKNLNQHIRDLDISFDEGEHKYTILDGKDKYISVTTLIGKLFEKFDADAIIKKIMNGKNWNPSNKYWNMTADEIKKMWNDNSKSVSKDGTNLHYEIECFMNQKLPEGVEYTHKNLLENYQKNHQKDNDNAESCSNEQEKEHNEEWEFFIKFVNNFLDFTAYRTEWMIYDSEYKIAGSIDMVYKNNDGTFSIYDWKRVKEINKSSSWSKYSTLEAINHIPDTNFWHYAIQLNIYKAILEKNYGVFIRDLYLVRIHPNNKRKSFDLIKLPFLTEEVKEVFKARLLNKVQ